MKWCQKLSIIFQNIVFNVELKATLCCVSASGVDPRPEAVVGGQSEGRPAAERDRQRRHHHRRHGRPARPLRHALATL